jgi:hypothetical protein
MTQHSQPFVYTLTLFTAFLHGDIVASVDDPLGQVLPPALTLTLTRHTSRHKNSLVASSCARSFYPSFPGERVYLLPNARHAPSLHLRANEEVPESSLEAPCMFPFVPWLSPDCSLMVP